MEQQQTAVAPSITGGHVPFWDELTVEGISCFYMKCWVHERCKQRDNWQHNFRVEMRRN